MRCTEFINRVGQCLGSRAPGAAGRAIVATPEVSGEHLGSEEAVDLARQLPGELKDPLTRQSADAKYY